MPQSGDWLDRAMAFGLGFLGTFLGLIFAWALTETFTPLRLPLGESPQARVAILTAISLAVAIWASRRAGRRSAAPKIGVRAPAVEDRATEAAAPKPGVRPPTAEDRAMAEAMVKAMVAQVRREEELHDGTWPAPLSVRLAAQIPIRDQPAPRSWLGGRPRLPATMPWPEIEGTPCDFIAQIALADLPADLWHGLGPREGWLALFLHPTSYRGHLLQIPELGPARDTPNPPAEKDGWYSPYGGRSGLDDVRQRQQRYMLRALPQWPMDVVVIPAGETGEEEGSRDDNLSHALYRKGFDVADPAYHPFDWPGMMALVDCALAALEFRYGQETPSPNMLEQQLAGLEARLAAGAPAAEAGKQPEPYTSEKIAEIERSAAALRELIPVTSEAGRRGLSALAAVRQIATEVHEQAERLPFTPQRAEALLTRLQAIHWMHVHRLTTSQFETRVLPITVHHPDAPLFAWDYHVLLFDMARHAYCRDIAGLPVATRALYEPLWRDLGMKSAPQLGGFPRSHVRAFSPDVDVIALELPSNDLMGWMFGDVDSLVLMMTQDQIATSRFAEAELRVGF
jgi:hypothetical protein